MSQHGLRRLAQRALSSALRLLRRFLDAETATPSSSRASGAASVAPLRPTLRTLPVPLDLVEEVAAETCAEPAPESGIPGPTVRGWLDDLALATLLEVLELERRSCLLWLADGSRVLELTVRRGAVVGAQLDAAPTDIVSALRTAFGWRRAEFRLRSPRPVSDSQAARSVNELLLQVFHQHDEAARAG